MAEVTVTLPDGTSRALPDDATGATLAAGIGGRIARDAVAVVVNGDEADLSRPLRDGASVELVPASSDQGRRILRHSTAHVMAQAVLDLWPGARYAIGPAIEDGFYYDFELPGHARFAPEDLGRIEQRMGEIVADDQPFERAELSAAEGRALFADQPYKLEIIDAAAGEPSSDGVDAAEEGAQAGVVSVYRNGRGFVDLCRGPHVPSTGKLGPFKLTRLAGAYWRGDERRPQLQRIYGTAWESSKALASYLVRLEEAERRDHRRLGAELDLFHFPPEIGGGLPVFHPKGALIRHIMEDFSRREHLSSGYQLVWTPHLAKAGLFETSGHLGWYADNMYPPMEMEGATYYPKPMSCPMHILVYRHSSHSYRELPLRLFELATVYRFERSGVLHGLTRVRGLTQDDSHIFCAPDQLAGELSELLAFVLRVLRTFGLEEFEAELATRPDKFVGDVEEWDHATASLHHALESSGLSYRVAEGEGAFYAPKIDVHLRDAIGRRWQVSTLQVDLQLPRLFELEYVGSDNARHRPCMIHRALFGSVERFLAILIEHYAGALPLWLSPLHAMVLPVRADHERYARSVIETLGAADVRADLDPATEPLGGRIRRAKLQKVPYVLVVGDDDVAASTVGVNERGSSKPERGVRLDALAARLAGELAARSA